MIEIAAGGATYRDVRRPREMSDLLAELTKDGRPFPTLRDALVFAAALGWSRNRREPFDQTAEPIRWGTMINRPGTEDLVNMMAAEATKDPDVLAAARVSERIEIFEEFAHGGLKLIQQILREQPARRPSTLLADLTRNALEEPTTRSQELPSDLDDLARELL